MKETVIPIFSDFIYHATLDVDENNLERYVKNIISNNTSRVRSNVGGYQSNDLELNDNILFLFNEIENHLHKTAQNIGFKRKLRLNNFWLNVNNHKDYNAPHRHPQSLMSGVFYIKVPENSGRIKFINPNGALIDSYLSYFHFQVGKDYSPTSLLASEWNITPEKNDLILFPPWLEHWVESNNSNEERISISFNYAT